MYLSSLISDEQRTFIEEWALLQEVHSRWPRSAGRLYAYLMVSDREQHEQQELAEALGISQASVSSMIRRLIDDGFVERIGVPGSRRDSYRLRPDGWGGTAQGIVMLVNHLVQQIDRGLALPGPTDSLGRRHMRGLRAQLAHLAAAFEAEANAPTP